MNNIEDILLEREIQLIFESDYGSEGLSLFIKQLDPKIFGINYDIGNSAALGFNPEEEITSYGERIYNLNYESLTIDQENQTRKLIKYLDLNWEDSCLSPQENKRIVRTASRQQIRKKVYTGSSEAWRKYEPYLNGAFDSLKSL